MRQRLALNANKPIRATRFSGDALSNTDNFRKIDPVPPAFSVFGAEYIDWLFIYEVENVSYVLENTKLILYEQICLPDRTAILFYEGKIGTMAFHQAGVHGVGMGRVKRDYMANLELTKERRCFPPVPPHSAAGGTYPLRNDYETVWTWFGSFAMEPFYRKGGESI